MSHRSYQTHNSVRDALAELCKEAKLATLSEPAFASATRAGNHYRPADLFIGSVSPSLSAIPTCIDVAVTNPLRPDFIIQSQRVALSAAEKYQTTKVQRADKLQYKRICAEHSFRYLPLCP